MTYAIDRVPGGYWVVRLKGETRRKLAFCRVKQEALQEMNRLEDRDAVVTGEIRLVRLGRTWQDVKSERAKRMHGK